MLQDVHPKTHPMTRPISTPDEISKIYDFVAYPKAASVIRMIEHIMTPEIFQKSLELHIAERWKLCLWLFCLRRERFSMKTIWVVLTFNYFQELLDINRWTTLRGFGTNTTLTFDRKLSTDTWSVQNVGQQPWISYSERWIQQRWQNGESFARTLCSFY